MSSQSLGALRVTSSREALRNYDLPPGGATPNPCRVAALAAVLGAQAPVVELSPSPSSFWAWSAFLAGVVLAFVIGWWFGRLRLGFSQLPALTRALFGAERAAAIAVELRELVELDAPKRQLDYGHTCNELGEIARQASSVATWVSSTQFTRPLGVPKWDKPEPVYPFSVEDKGGRRNVRVRRAGK